MVWFCFAASGPGRIINSAVNQKNREGVCPAIWQENYPKSTSSFTYECLNTEDKMKTLDWPGQSPGLDPTEMRLHDLIKVVCVQKPFNVAELQQGCKVEWAKIPPQLLKIQCRLLQMLHFRCCC